MRWDESIVRTRSIKINYDKYFISHLTVFFSNNIYEIVIHNQIFDLCWMCHWLLLWIGLFGLFGNLWCRLVCTVVYACIRSSMVMSRRNTKFETVAAELIQSWRCDLHIHCLWPFPIPPAPQYAPKIYSHRIRWPYHLT